MCVADVKIVLAFGNYMNSSKRGLASGFHLQSLDLVSLNSTTGEYRGSVVEHCDVTEDFVSVSVAGH